MLDHIAEQSGCSQRTQYALFTEILGIMQMIQHGGHYAARTTRRSSDNLASGGILLAHSQGIRI